MGRERYYEIFILKKVDVFILILDLIVLWIISIVEIIEEGNSSLEDLIDWF